MKIRGMCKTEIHIHTRYSHDSLLPLWILYIMCRIRNVQCIAITDHNRIDGAIHFKNIYTNINVIVGEEISTKQGEVIGLFLKKNIPAGLSASETIQKICSQGGIVCIPHPCDEKRKKTVMPEEVIAENLNSIHCIEYYNGRTINIKDLKQQKQIADFFHLPCLIGSDAHTFIELGRNYLLCKNSNIVKENFIENICEAEMKTSNCLRIAHWLTKFDRAIKLIVKGNFIELTSKIKSKIGVFL